MGEEKSITIGIKAKLYGQLEAIKSYIGRLSTYSDDPFFRIGKAGKSGLKDLAKAHDEYLYGRKP